MVLPSAAQRVVSTHLRSYAGLRRELRELERDQLLGGYETSFEPRSGGGRPANPTQGRALRLADDRHAGELKRVVGAVDRALAAADERVAKCVLAHYVHGVTWDRAARALGISRQTAWRWERWFSVSVWAELQK